MNPSQPKNNQQPPEKTNGFFSLFSSKKRQQSSIRIGIWGTVSSGKTIYLVRLFEQLQHSKNWQLFVDTKAKKFANDFSTAMNNDNKEGTLPPPTSFHEGDEQQFDIFTYTLIPKNSQVSPSTIILEFIDAPGEFFENTDYNLDHYNLKVSDSLSGGQRTYNIIDYLMSCHGVIFLLDYERSNQKMKKDDETKGYYDLLLNLFSEFQLRSPKLNKSSYQYIQQYMAFCVTKADKDGLWGKKRFYVFSERNNGSNYVEFSY
jgi:hypothetical protein